MLWTECKDFIVLKLFSLCSDPAIHRLVLLVYYSSVAGSEAEGFSPSVQHSPIDSEPDYHLLGQLPLLSAWISTDMDPQGNHQSPPATGVQGLSRHPGSDGLH